jgi:phosphoribosylglycinamide formyltransferase-1
MTACVSSSICETESQMTTTLKLGFLASHGGSSMRAIVTAIREQRLDAETRLAISNNGDSPALAFAREAGLDARHISARTQGSADAADAAICDAMRSSGVELIVLSGYLRKLGPCVLDAYRHRILNIHPALLPRYGGEGMYGRKVHEAVIAAGDAVSGATIHLVDAEYDTGPILARVEVPSHPGDTAEGLEQRVMAAEPAFFVQTLQAISEGRLKLPETA